MGTRAPPTSPRGEASEAHAVADMPLQRKDQFLRQAIHNIFSAERRGAGSECIWCMHASTNMSCLDVVTSHMYI